MSAAKHSATIPFGPSAPELTARNLLDQFWADVYGNRLGLRTSDDHPVAIEATAEKFVGGAPKVQPETAIVEFAKLLHDSVAVLVKIARPLLEREKIAEAIVEHFLHTQRSSGHLVEEVVENEERVVSSVDVLHHKRRELVFLRAGARIEKDASSRFEQFRELSQHATVVRQMLDNAHDDDRIVFSFSPVLQEITYDKLPVESELPCAAGKVIN